MGAKERLEAYRRFARIVYAEINALGDKAEIRSNLLMSVWCSEHTRMQRLKELGIPIDERVKP